MDIDKQKVMEEIRAALHHGDQIEDGEFLPLEYAEAIGVSESTATRDLRAAVQQGLLAKRYVVLEGRRRTVYRKPATGERQHDPTQ
jgi:DeoR/GlpR family transcriptional regulator of sugar metabolism